MFKQRGFRFGGFFTALQSFIYFGISQLRYVLGGWRRTSPGERPDEGRQESGADDEPSQERHEAASVLSLYVALRPFVPSEYFPLTLWLHTELACPSTIIQFAQFSSCVLFFFFLFFLLFLLFFFLLFFLSTLHFLVIENLLTLCRHRKTQWFFVQCGFYNVAGIALANYSVNYLNYATYVPCRFSHSSPTPPRHTRSRASPQILLRSSRVVATMIGGIFILGTCFMAIEYLGVLLVTAGMVVFSSGDVRAAKAGTEFSSLIIGVVLNIGSLALSRTKLAGMPRAYLPGLAAHGASKLFAGDAKTDERGAMVIAKTALGIPDALLAVADRPPK